MRPVRRAAAVARRYPGLAFIALPTVVVALVVLAVWPSGRAPAADRAAVAAGVIPVVQDRSAPAFSRPLVTGSGELGPAAFRGRVVVVNFWASWCAACKNEMPRLRDLARTEQQADVTFLGVDHEDTRAAARAFLEHYRPGYRSVFDPGGDVLHAYGGIGVPSTFIIDRTGRIRYQAVGTFDATAFRAALGRVVTD